MRPIDLFGVARAQGFQLSSQPAPGEMVVYGSSYGIFGHIATVVAVEPDRYEVIEQNFLDFNPNLEPHWQTFDLRSIGGRMRRSWGLWWLRRRGDGAGIRTSGCPRNGLRLHHG